MTENEIRALIRQYYGLDVALSVLAGYEEMNFQVTDASGKKYVLKIAPVAFYFPFLDAQEAILNHLSGTEVSPFFQECIKNLEGSGITRVQVNGKEFHLRLLTFLEGTFWVEKANRTEKLHYSLGQFMARMDKVLVNFSHPAMHRRYTWDISTATDNWIKLEAIQNAERRRLAGYFLLQFETQVVPMLTQLRQAYIHNDANDYNVLVEGDRVSGLIDFGDMVYSALVNNLAVACTYAMLNEQYPLAVAERIVKGYHDSYPLLPEEVDLLYYLIAGRLCISVIQSAVHSAAQSGNEHHYITEKNAWHLLQQLIRINPLLAKDTFRKACGFSSVIMDEAHMELLKDRHAYIGRNLSISYKKKIKIVQGALQYLYDDQGRTYVDCVNNPSHVGHCHPVVVKRVQRQLATLNTNTRYLSDLMVQYAKIIAATLPEKLKVCYFVNSGSEANDLAIRMSRCYTGSEEVIVLDHAYHGNSTLAIDISPYKFDSKGGTGQKPWVHKAINPDTYRGPYAGHPDPGQAYAADVHRIIASMKEQNKKPAAFICETLLGVGGQMPLPKGYLEKVYEQVHAAGGICIADEVQVGFGRVGEAFWGFELQGVEPDIVVLGKPIGNGHPMGAVVVTEAIAEAFNNGLEYFNTFGGNPVSMATGLAVMEVIREEKMQAHALEVGDRLMNGMRLLMEQHPIIADVRGHGLFIGVELVKDRFSKVPAVPEIDEIVEQMKERGFLLSTDGPYHNILKIKPPMPFNGQNADELCRNLGEVLQQHNRK